MSCQVLVFPDPGETVPKSEAQRHEPLGLEELHLEEKFGAELQHTGIGCTSYLPEVAIVATAIHLVELGVVEGIKRLYAELQM
jgi:hypothetical protein